MAGVAALRYAASARARKSLTAAHEMASNAGNSPQHLGRWPRRDTKINMYSSAAIVASRMRPAAWHLIISRKYGRACRKLYHHLAPRAGWLLPLAEARGVASVVSAIWRR